MAYCTHPEGLKYNIEYHSTTGEKISTTTILNYLTLNKNNDCIYFKRRWFAPKIEKKYCVNCTKWEFYSGGGCD